LEKQSLPHPAEIYTSCSVLDGFPHTRRLGSVATGARAKRRKRKMPMVGREDRKICREFSGEEQL